MDECLFFFNIYIQLYIVLVPVLPEVVQPPEPVASENLGKRTSPPAKYCPLS